MQNDKDACGTIASLAELSSYFGYGACHFNSGLPNMYVLYVSIRLWSHTFLFVNGLSVQFVSFQKGTKVAGDPTGIHEPEFTQAQSFQENLRALVSTISSATEDKMVTPKSVAFVSSCCCVSICICLYMPSGYEGDLNHPILTEANHSASSHYFRITTDNNYISA